LACCGSSRSPRLIDRPDDRERRDAVKFGSLLSNVASIGRRHHGILVRLGHDEARRRCARTIRRRARAAHCVGSSDTGLDGGVCERRGGPRHRGHHCRGRGRRAPAGHGGRSHGGARSRGSGSERRASGSRFAAVDRADAGRGSRRHAGHRQGRGDQRRYSRSVDPRELTAGSARAAARFPRRQTERVRQERLP
jgi:hypothetical protein